MRTISKWYVVQVLSGQEQVTASLMQRLGTRDVLKRAFVPHREVMRHSRQGWRKVAEVLFSGYVFVVTDDPGALSQQLRSVPAFTRLLGDENVFTPLSDDEVSLITAFGGDEVLVHMSEGVIEGDEIRILKGPLQGYEGIIRKIDRHKRVAYVDMHLMGRSSQVKLGLEIVRKS